jgi:DNA-binding CsgD family transcriptional regulator
MMNRLVLSYRERGGGAAGRMLSRTERAILQDVSIGMSRSEIAAAHNVSINTVKTTMPVIFDKLGAVNSANAVSIAFDDSIFARERGRALRRPA